MSNLPTPEQAAERIADQLEWSSKSAVEIIAAGIRERDAELLTEAALMVAELIRGGKESA